MTLVDKFEYGTYEIQKNAKETIKKLGYKYGHLALVRNDFLCPNCDELHELWSVVNLVTGAYPWPSASFWNIDDGLAYVYEISTLAEWDTIDEKQTHKLATPLVAICLKHKGLPIKVLSLMFDIKGASDEGVPPGTIAGLNGYTKQ